MKGWCQTIRWSFYGWFSLSNFVGINCEISILMALNCVIVCCGLCALLYSKFQTAALLQKRNMDIWVMRVRSLVKKIPFSPQWAYFGLGPLKKMLLQDSMPGPQKTPVLARSQKSSSHWPFFLSLPSWFESQISDCRPLHSVAQESYERLVPNYKVIFLWLVFFIQFYRE